MGCSPKRHPLKDPVTYSYVLEKLLKGWSPEQISGRLKRKNDQKIICPETIYQFIYSPDHKDLALWEYLPRKQKRRQRKFGRASKRLHIPNRVSIHLRPKEVEETLNAQREIFSSFLCRSVTTDNGFEFIGHERLKDLGIATYFADPYSSWQRGTNEHHNGLLRRYLPKKTDFENLSQEELDDMVWEINNKPRKMHGFLTAQEMLESEQKATGVAIQSRM